MSSIEFFFKNSRNKILRLLEYVKYYLISLNIFIIHFIFITIQLIETRVFMYTNENFVLSKKFDVEILAEPFVSRSSE